MVTRHSKPTVVFVAALAVATVPTLAYADAKADAAHRWEAAVELRDNGDYAGAISELKKAYDLSPDPAVLFALGKAYVTLDKPVEAVDALERFLAAGKGRITHQQRVEAEMALRKQRERIGSVDLRVTPAGASVSLDGIELGVAPLANRIHTAAGLHTVVVSLAGHTPTTLEVEVAGGKDKPVEVTLQPLPIQKGTIQVDCAVPDVAVTANGTRVGSTPLTSAILLPIGDYRLRFERPGYVDAEHLVTVNSERPATVNCGVKLVAPLPSNVKAKLRIVGATQDIRTQIDGELVPSEVELPSGLHHVQVSKPGYRPWEREVTLIVGTTTDLRPEFAPSADWMRQPEKLASSSQRTWAYALGVGGLVLGAGALGLKIWNDEHYIKERDAAARSVQQYHADIEEKVQQQGRGWTQAELDKERALVSHQHDLNNKAVVVNGVDIGLAAGAGALFCTGVILWLSSSGEGTDDKVAVVPRRDGASISWWGAF